MSDISVAVLEDMRLHIAPQEVARDAEHNSATFRIVSQPSSLDALACRAEIQTDDGTTYRLVEDGAFALTNDIAVRGLGKLQLVYSDGVDVMRKTSIATFHVSPSLNAVDPSAPGFGDGLAQLQSAAFTSVVDPPPGGDVATFFNINGNPVAVLRFPPSAVGGDLTEDRANGLYLRLSGLGMMQGSVGISGPNRGIVWEDSGVQGALYSTGTQLVLRLPTGNPPFLIENNSGDAGTRTPVLTQQSGDARYLTSEGANLTYLRRDGGQMTGPFISQLGTSLTNLGLSIGDNSTGFWRTSGFLILSVGGSLALQWSPTEMFMGQPINMATQRITNVGAPTVATDAANRSYVESAVAAVPRPNSRTYTTNTVDLTTTAQVLFDQPYPVANNNPRTVTITVFPSFSGGTPSQFHDLIYTCSLAPLVEARTTVYPTAAAYMSSPVRFAATVTPVSNAIQVQVVVRLNAAVTGTLTITGSAADKRSYVTIEEQAN